MRFPIPHARCPSLLRNASLALVGARAQRERVGREDPAQVRRLGGLHGWPRGRLHQPGQRRRILDRRPRHLRHDLPGRDDGEGHPPRRRVVGCDGRTRPRTRRPGHRQHDADPQWVPGQSIQLWRARQGHPVHHHHRLHFDLGLHRERSAGQGQPESRRRSTGIREARRTVGQLPGRAHADPVLARGDRHRRPLRSQVGCWFPFHASTPRARRRGRSASASWAAALLPR